MIRNMATELALRERLAADPFYLRLRARLEALQQLVVAYEHAAATGALDPPEAVNERRKEEEMTHEHRTTLEADPAQEDR